MATATKDLPPLPDSAAAEAEEAPKPPAGVFRRLTSKLRAPSQSWVHVSTPPAGLDDVQEDPTAKKEKPKRKPSTHRLAFPGTRKTAGPDLENSFTSPEQRQAALRAAGLVGGNARPGRDTHGYMLPLSEQEKALDKEYATTPGDVPRSSEERESEAQRIKEAWLRKNSDVLGDSGSSSRAASRSPDRLPPRRSKEQQEVRQEQEREIQGERERTESPKPPKTSVMTSDQIRARRGNDPVFAPQGLMEAMQAYRPQNYRPPPGRKPSGPPAAAQRMPVESPSDTDSDESM